MDWAFTKPSTVRPRFLPSHDQGIHHTLFYCRSERYGETSPECADVFFWYGRALLELARIENGVLGNAL